MLIIGKWAAIDPKWGGVGYLIVGAAALGLFPLVDGLVDPAGPVLWQVLGGAVFTVMLGVLGARLLIDSWVIRSGGFLRVEGCRYRLETLRGVSAGDPQMTILDWFSPVFVFDGPGIDIESEEPAPPVVGSEAPVTVCDAVLCLKVSSYTPKAAARTWRRARRLARWLDVPLIDLPPDAAEQEILPIPDS